MGDLTLCYAELPGVKRFCGVVMDPWETRQVTEHRGRLMVPFVIWQVVALRGKHPHTRHYWIRPAWAAAGRPWPTSDRRPCRSGSTGDLGLLPHQRPRQGRNSFAPYALKN